MSKPEIEAKVELAQELVKGLDADLKKIAFEIILKRLLEDRLHREPSGTFSGGKKVRERPKTRVQLTPIPLDLKGGNGVPPLRRFHEEKAPANNQETVVTFVYYLKKYLKLDEPTIGHILSCYNEVGTKKPLRMDQLIRDTAHGKGWLEPGKSANSARITIAGENLVEHDLPRRKE
jgi:hypothetical protein